MNRNTLIASAAFVFTFAVAPVYADDEAFAEAGLYDASSTEVTPVSEETKAQKQADELRDQIFRDMQHD